MINLHGFSQTLAAGLWITVKLTLSSLLLGLVLGLAGAGAKVSRYLLLRKTADYITTLIRGLPELILILAIYFGGGVILNNIMFKFGYRGVELNAFVAGTFALGVNFAAYASEIFRSAILAVPNGQIEAARAFGMRSFTLFLRIMLPQVWRIALPGIGNLFLILQKNTALVSVIGLHELMRNTTVAVAYTKQPFTFYLFAALVYLGITIVSAAGIQLLEKRSMRGFTRG